MKSKILGINPLSVLDQANMPKVIARAPVASEYLARVTITRNEPYLAPEQAASLQLKQVGFNIVGLPGFQNKYPVAYPMFDSVREMKPGDLILVRDVQRGGCLHTFFYMPYREDEFFGIWNEGKLIGASLDDQIQIAVFGEEKKKGHPDQIEGTTTAKSEILVSNTASSSSGTAVPTITIRCGDDRTITVNDTTINISCGPNVSMNMTGSSVDINCGKSVSLNMTNTLTTINGDVTISGDVTVKKDINASGDVTAANKTVSLISHTHQGTCNYAGAYTTLAPGVPAPPKPTSDNSES